ncbi:copper chaperone CopZ [Pullulanibacillus pueri]|uniref:HMA domain-containing protein n=1 Tax=Pullulanibacillus pueri TaxID=1437324 RepID=A0A8J2ZTD3_9BACL|nr:heavy metal-associated domain-containing protein [Pullulanibacillus pueri]MBM7680239.1 copper chaperone CopZ [Pullulanibacillus pueri]GGH76056.1 hypothetical protein GCM10007096_05930 [Pullulanibacillus pueri]
MKKWLVIGLTSLALIICGVLALGERPDSTKAGENKVTFEGVDLNCHACQAKAEVALSNIIGIDSYKLHPHKHAITVSFDPEVMKADWIEKSLEASGFKAKMIKP